MVPMWSRTQRFASAYAFAILDILFFILWFSAWAAVASYVTSGKGKGPNTKESGCDNFSHGSAERCKLSEASICLGVVICLLFAVTSYFSVKGVIYYRKTGTMPVMPDRGGSNFAAQTKDDFSSQTQDDFETEPMGANAGARREDDAYALLHQSEVEDGAHPGRPVSYGHGRDDSVSNRYDTSYGGAYGRHDEEQLPAYPSV